MLSFKITVDNVGSLLRLSDKFEIEYLLEEIKVIPSGKFANIDFRCTLGNTGSSKL
jgi:hypothetical protein